MMSTNDALRCQSCVNFISLTKSLDSYSSEANVNDLASELRTNENRFTWRFRHRSRVQRLLVIESVNLNTIEMVMNVGVLAIS
jgi:hypothetical protein